jgi:delta-aminolevulinic acid dehydratase/porphobilinogen synthase
MIKSKFPEAVVCTDVALDPYSSMVQYARTYIQSSID